MVGLQLAEKLERLIGEIGDLNSKLILLVGPSRSGKTQLLRQLGAKLSIEPLNVGLELVRRLAEGCNQGGADPDELASLNSGRNGQTCHQTSSGLD